MRAEADRERDREHQRRGQHVAGNAGEHVAVDQRLAADVHRAEAVDDPAREIVGDADGRRRGAEADAHEQHARHDVVDVVGAGVDRAAEQVHEHQHQQDRQRERGDQRVDVAHRQSQRAHDHRQRFGEGRRRGRDAAHPGASATYELSGIGCLAFGRVCVVSGEGHEDVVEARCVQREALDPIARPGRARRATRAPRRRCRPWRPRRSALERSLCTARRPRPPVRRSNVSASSRRRSSRSPATSCFSSSAVPSATILPPSSTAIRSARWSASSRCWVVSSTVTPAAARSVTSAHIACRLRGSRPVVGSSRKITSGLAIRLAGEVQPAAHPARVGRHAAVGRFGEVEPREQLTRASARRPRRQPPQPAHHLEVLGPGLELVERGVLAGQADPPSYLVALAPRRRSRRPGHGRRPARPASRGSARSSSCPRRSDPAAQTPFPRATARSMPSSTSCGVVGLRQARAPRLRSRCSCRSFVVD